MILELGFLGVLFGFRVQDRLSKGGSEFSQGSGNPVYFGHLPGRSFLNHFRRGSGSRDLFARKRRSMLQQSLAQRTQYGYKLDPTSV